MGTITKALEMLNFFSRSTPELGLSDFVRRTERDKATVHRHLGELLENGFLEQNPVSRAYRLGPAILRLAAVRETSLPIRSVVRPVVETLAAEVGELVHFSLLHGATLSPVCHADPAAHGTQVHFDEAEVLPLHATSSGLAMLAFGPDTLRETVFAGPLKIHADGTVTDPAQLGAMIGAIRTQGISSVEKGFDNEVTSQAIPVFGPEASVIGALAIAVPLARMNKVKRAETARALVGGMLKVTTAIGGVIPSEYRGIWQADAASVSA